MVRKIFRRAVSRFLVWIVVFACPMAVPQSFAAPSGQLLVEMDLSTASLRTAAPIDMTWNVQWLGKAILEGHFEIEVRMENQVVAHCQTHDVVLSPGQQRMPVRVPSLNFQTYWSQPELHLQFVTKDETLKVNTNPLRGRPGYHAFTLCVCQGVEGRTTSYEDDLIKSLHLEKMVSDRFPTRLNTTTTHWNRDDVPASPLRYCTFDIVIATREGFVNLRTKQLDALDRWVRAGGSLCILVGKELPEYQLNYLNRLAREQEKLVNPQEYLDRAQKGGPLFLSNGMLDPEFQTDIDQDLWLIHQGLGRIAVVDLKRVNESTHLKMDLRKIACHLWNVRHAENTEIIDNELLDASLTETEMANQEQMIQQQFALANQSSVSTGGQLVTRLMPRDVRVVPLGLIATLLIGYVILIGPVDYFILGFFKSRRWTWFTFPMVTIATTILCVKISNSYLSSQDTGHSLTVLDVDAWGRLVRENQFQMVFTSTRREVTTKVQQKLFTVMDHQRMDVMNQSIRYGRAMSSMGVELPRYQGRYPVDFAVTQTIPQWTPLLYRTLSIPVEDQTIDFPWDQAQGLLTTDRGRAELAKIIQVSLSPQASAGIFNQKLLYQLAAGRAHPGTEAALGYQNPPYRFRSGYPDPYPYSQQNRTQGQYDLRMSNSIGNLLSIRPALGLNRLISRVSSHGGDSFDDLALLDPTDPSQWLLTITYKHEDDWIMLRRLYTGVTP